MEIKTNRNETEEPQYHYDMNAEKSAFMTFMRMILIFKMKNSYFCLKMISIPRFLQYWNMLLLKVQLNLYSGETER